MDWLLKLAFRQIIERGSLIIRSPSGQTLSFGDGQGPPVGIRFTDRMAVVALVLDPDLKLGELYTDGRLIMEQGGIYDFLRLVHDQPAALRKPLLGRLVDRARLALRWLSHSNGAARSRRNVAHHYDLDGRLYDLFLDEDRQYSCAYYETPEATLEEAQRAKRRHIAAKLAIRPGDRVLDIGCGWGGLGLYLAGVAGAGEVLGVTLSEEQLATAQRRARESGLDGAVRFEMQDYRAVEGRFDRIVSVGMFEHVGLHNQRTFFEKCKSLLADDGVMLLHTIGLSDGPWFTNPWIDKYIFPGGHLPALSELMPWIEKSGLVLTDVEILRLHYASTLRDWRERFMARRGEAAKLYDERFCRMWEFYLAGCEAAFRWRNVVVFQLQLARRQDAAPLTRNYIEEGEAALRRAEAGSGRSAVPEGRRLASV